MHEYKTGDRIKATVGPRSSFYYVYGTVTGIMAYRENALYICEWDEGGIDYNLACEIEPA